MLTSVSAESWVERTKWDLFFMWHSSEFGNTVIANNWKKTNKAKFVIALDHKSFVNYLKNNTNQISLCAWTTTIGSCLFRSPLINASITLTTTKLQLNQCLCNCIVNIAVILAKLHTHVWVYNKRPIFFDRLLLYFIKEDIRWVHSSSKQWIKLRISLLLLLT